MSPDAVTQHRDRRALFLDVDGTLLDVAETQQRVHVPEGIKQLLVALTVLKDQVRRHEGRHLVVSWLEGVATHRPGCS